MIWQYCLLFFFACQAAGRLIQLTADRACQVATKQNRQESLLGKGRINHDGSKVKHQSMVALLGRQNLKPLFSNPLVAAVTQWFQCDVNLALFKNFRNRAHGRHT
jgi:hypothetical protein